MVYSSTITQYTFILDSSFLTIYTGCSLFTELRLKVNAYLWQKKYFSLLKNKYVQFQYYAFKKKIV